MISIVVPVYNVEGFLRKCINSILAQSYKNYELLLIDDGSIDSSGRICNEYSSLNSKIKVFHQKNQGVSAARNFGVLNASGDYILFVDADDYLPDNALELLYVNASVTLADITIGGYTRVYDNQSSDEQLLEEGIASGIDFVKSILSGNWRIYGPVAKLYKKELFASGKSILLDGKIRVGEDVIMNIKLGLSAKMVSYIPKPVYYYYQRNTSAVHTFSYTIEYLDRILRVVKNEINRSEYKDELKYSIVEFRINSLYLLLLDDFEDKVDYKSEWVLSIVNDSNSIKKTSKQTFIIFLAKNKKARVIFRSFLNNYRNAGSLYQLLNKFNRIR